MLIENQCNIERVSIKGCDCIDRHLTMDAFSTPDSTILTKRLSLLVTIFLCRLL